jgi:hypothetical protein
MNIVKETDNHYYITCSNCDKVLQYPKRVKPRDSNEWTIRAPKVTTCLPCHYNKENK